MLCMHHRCSTRDKNIIWYHQCSVGYSTNNFIGQPDSNRIGVWTSMSNVTDPQEFKQKLDELLVVLWEAAANVENRNFGWGDLHPRVFEEGNETNRMTLPATRDEDIDVQVDAFFAKQVLVGGLQRVRLRTMDSCHQQK
ncbi:hypothetical protein IEQ34_006240 [Dendrobium chrysotoxum]|uniref:Uncharacterized protein n=1 Tax=Dendrobium chrysotoxum TaxID=161865 RepID=A0AAV7HB85_DENCH|nr:hypothetical protein IEQ34_006240 [Dendrobium chrysotoxum]